MNIMGALLLVGAVLGDRQEEYKAFAQDVQAIISQASAVAQTERETSDVRTLQWLLRDYKKHVAAGNWRQADQVRDRMKVALHRSGRVMDDAPRRKAERQHAIEERRHREQLDQSERQHREYLDQRERQYRERVIQRTRPRRIEKRPQGITWSIH